MKKSYSVYYMTPDAWPRFNFGQEFPTVADLEKTHRRVRHLVNNDMEEVFLEMQAEIWSPNGEANRRIKMLGLAHTSMSVGDVIRDHDSGKHFVVAPIGFKEIE